MREYLEEAVTVSSSSLDKIMSKTKLGISSGCNGLLCDHKYDQIKNKAPCLRISVVKTEKLVSFEGNKV